MQFFKASLKKYTDEQLMQKATEGNGRAFEELYERYATKLLSYFHRMLWKDKELAEDSLHKLFLKIIENPEQFDTTRNFKTWLYSAAHNLCKNEYRRMKNHLPDETVAQQPAMGEQSMPPMQENTFDNKQFLTALDTELDLLTDNHRQTFELRYFEHLSLKEIADIMQCSEGTVKSRLFYALKALSQKLKPFKNLLQQ
jgi:RNA polymerase sigma factor (sigma-70 family)